MNKGHINNVFKVKQFNHGVTLRKNRVTHIIDVVFT